VTVEMEQYTDSVEMIECDGREGSFGAERLDRIRMKTILGNFQGKISGIGAIEVLCGCLCRCLY